VEIGAIAAGETPDAATIALAFSRFQKQLDSWGAQRTTLSFQPRTQITWPASTSTQTIGPSGSVNMVRPVFVYQLNYVVPGSSPEVEVVLAPMDQDSYAAQSLKNLSSALPLSFFYQTTIDTELGSLFLWPQPSQELTLYLYNGQAVPIPTALSDEMIAPVGYAEAFLYQLADRLLTPFAIKDPAVVRKVEQNAAESFKVMKRPNLQPSLMGVDAALVPAGGAGYNVLTDNNSGFTR